jgi:undecaprenyl-diphosphatase
MEGWYGRHHTPLTPSTRVDNMAHVTPKQALIIGLTQCLALIPGTSRSAASIIGGLCAGLSRRVAVEFSFFLAMPTLMGAGLYSLYQARREWVFGDLPLFAIGLLMAFVSAWLCVRWFLRYISHHNFVPFALYRIGFGLLIVGTMF